MKGYTYRAFSPAEGNGKVIPLEDGDRLIRGYDEQDGIFVPNPAATKPKHGHWRIAPGGRLKMKPRHTAAPAIGVTQCGRVDGDYVREDMRRKETRRARRERLLMALREDGHL